MKKLMTVLLIVVLVAAFGIGLAACNKDKGTESTELRFVMPDGTPALSAADFFGKTVRLDKYSVTTELVAATSIQTEIGGEKADMVIAPTNAGAMLIKNGAPYTLAAVMVEGSLYVIGKPVHGNNILTFDDLKGKKIASIGQNNTPDKVFKYVVDNTDGISYSDFEIEFVADGPAALAAMSRESNPCDFAIVGEPAATMFGLPAKGGYSARLDIQAAYKAVNGDDVNFPQASLFVKNKLMENEAFTTALFSRLNDSQEWAQTDNEAANNLLKANGSTSVFYNANMPALNIVQRCAITVQRTDAASVQASVRSYLKLMVPSVEWNGVDLF